MDSHSRLNIINFIKEFGLKKPDGITSFDAVVTFRRQGYRKTIGTEVQIITSANLEAVYLINPEISKEGLPDTFRSGNEIFMYIQHECLYIKNEKDASAYDIMIFPGLPSSSL